MLRSEVSIELNRLEQDSNLYEDKAHDFVSGELVILSVTPRQTYGSSFYCYAINTRN